MMTHTKMMIFKFQFPPFLSMKTMFLMMKILMMTHYMNQLFKWILNDKKAVIDKDEVNKQPQSETTVNPTVVRAMKNLEASFNPEALKMVADAKIGNELLLYQNQAQLH